MFLITPLSRYKRPLNILSSIKWFFITCIKNASYSPKTSNLLNNLFLLPLFIMLWLFFNAFFSSHTLPFTRTTTSNINFIHCLWQLSSFAMALLIRHLCAIHTFFSCRCFSHHVFFCFYFSYHKGREKE